MNPASSSAITVSVISLKLVQVPWVVYLMMYSPSILFSRSMIPVTESIVKPASLVKIPPVSPVIVGVGFSASLQYCSSL